MKTNRTGDEMRIFFATHNVITAELHNWWEVDGYGCRLVERQINTGGRLNSSFSLASS